MPMEIDWGELFIYALPMTTATVADSIEIIRYN